MSPKRTSPSPSVAHYCHRCGAGLPPASSFCPECGERTAGGPQDHEAAESPAPHANTPAPPVHEMPPVPAQMRQQEAPEPGPAVVAPERPVPPPPGGPRAERAIWGYRVGAFLVDGALAIALG